MRLLREKKRAGGGNCRRVSPGDAASGMLYADDAGVVSQSPEQLRKMLAFGLTVSEAKTEIMYVFTHEGDAGVHRHILRSCVDARRGCRSPPPHSA